MEIVSEFCVMMFFIHLLCSYMFYFCGVCVSKDLVCIQVHSRRHRQCHLQTKQRSKQVLIAHIMVVMVTEI